MRKNKGEKRRRRHLKEKQQHLLQAQRRQAYAYLKMFGVLASGQAQFESGMVQFGTLFGNKQ